MMYDPTNPDHYKWHPTGIECITITEHMTKNLGCAVDYIWRYPATNDPTDLDKAIWYLRREKKRWINRTSEPQSSPTPVTPL